MGLVVARVRGAGGGQMWKGAWRPGGVGPVWAGEGSSPREVIQGHLGHLCLTQMSAKLVSCWPSSHSLPGS